MTSIDGVAFTPVAASTAMQAPAPTSKLEAHLMAFDTRRMVNWNFECKNYTFDHAASIVLIPFLGNCLCDAGMYLLL